MAGISEAAVQLRAKIEAAVQCHTITHEEYEQILALAYEDGVLDRHEKVLLQQLQSMIADRDIKFVGSKN